MTKRIRRADDDGHEPEQFLGLGHVAELRTRRMTKQEQREHAQREPIGFLRFKWQKPTRTRRRA